MFQSLFARTLRAPARRTRPRLRTLEDRLTPATATLQAGVLTVTYTATGTTAESAALLTDGTLTTFQSGSVGQEFNSVAVTKIVVQDNGGSSKQELTLG